MTGTGGRLFEIVIEDRAIGRILTAWLLLGQRRVGIEIPMHAMGRLRLIEDDVGRRHFRIDLAKRGDVIEDPERTAMGADDDVVIVNDEIADRGGRHVEPQGVPVVAVIEGDEDGPFRAGE